MGYNEGLIGYSSTAEGRAMTTTRETERKYEAIEGLELLDPPGLLGFETGSGPQE